MRGDGGAGCGGVWGGGGGDGGKRGWERFFTYWQYDLCGEFEGLEVVLENHQQLECCFTAIIGGGKQTRGNLKPRLQGDGWTPILYRTMNKRADHQSPIVGWGRHEVGGKMRAADGAKCFRLPPQFAGKREEIVGGNEE